MTLIILEFDLPPTWRREQNIHEEQGGQNSNNTNRSDEKPARHTRDHHHHQTGRNENQRRAEIRFLHDEDERQRDQPKGLEEDARHSQFLHGPAEEMSKRKNERELGELRRLKQKNFQIEPPSCTASQRRQR